MEYLGVESSTSRTLGQQVLSERSTDELEPRVMIGGASFTTPYPNAGSPALLKQLLPSPIHQHGAAQ
ncbi:hypothetical protein PCASD_13080 [Puccinia coronata f. sp. avenae]|uniref:Uncharacterized protein n=1 Tax=Puccinia coronata f. sp. avenae TaxID=200324 RepID=A0A2N5U8K7_9BASI|nr:hypothetical protein PCASD_13080 [Puccinia coronata f. sp. avenae]